LDDPTTTSDEHRPEAEGSSDRSTKSAVPQAEPRMNERRQPVQLRREPMLRVTTVEPQGGLRQEAAGRGQGRQGRHEQLVPRAQQLLQEPTGGSHRRPGGCW
jgi:hypothetical protein